MNRKMVRKNWLVLLALVISVPFVSRPALSAEGSKTEVMEAAAQFYSALNTMFTGKLGPMKQVWSHAPDVTYMGPAGGFQVGWTDVLAIWEKQAALKLGGSVKPKDMQVNVSKDLAVVQNYEVGKNVKPNGKVEAVSIRATNIFRKEDGKWKMIGHHTDLIPYLAK